MRSRTCRGVVTVLLALWPAVVAAHPAPYSYIDIRIDGARVDGDVVLHVYDVAHDLSMPDPDALLDRAVLPAVAARLHELLTLRLAIEVDGTRVPIAWGRLDPAPDRHGIRQAFTLPAGTPGRIGVAGVLFAYDPAHQTFINVYEGGTLRHQAILDAGGPRTDYYAGTTRGVLAVAATFVPAGIEHILIGPDHILFLVALVVLGGSLARLATIVTAFTVGHSITLALAATGVLMPPAAVVEPAIALSIIVVGVDNLLVTRSGDTRDLRAWAALAFGLVHGFGFAAVLRDFGLPPMALGWSLFAFNLGVELGQVFIVVLIVLLLARLRRWSPAAARRVAAGASILVILAGTWWFTERILA